ncbi:T9SS type A sorting domain-containing protein [Flammeovirga sp. MY04]|uniref:WD40/YVTN/BNR-like repeat-containing protein n=1 Tax=Flammeovirga sp. MY04 TaxID=1191459 RepID=UPI0008257AB3|nr:T9SS type A sorting domain-containing protein [Flammeovirga sp. MY04]ANQ48393.2 T9SS type A sorting domain-containing protein [Flammeovirga sp. MY04]
MKRFYYFIYILILSSVVGFWIYSTFYAPVDDTPFINEYSFSDTEPNPYKLNDKIIRADMPGKFLKMKNTLSTKKGNNESNYPLGYKNAEIKAHQVSESNPYFDSIVWAKNGPTNVSGTIYSIVSDKFDTNDNTWLATTAEGDIWKTKNRGKHWTCVTDSLPNIPITKIIQSPSQPQIFYAITGEAYGKRYIQSGNGLLKSTDNGNTWQIVKNTLENEKFQAITSIIIDPNDHKTLLIGTTQRINDNTLRSFILKTKDEGENWEEVYESNSIIQALEYQPNNFKVILAGVKNQGIIKSINSGRTWGKVGNNFKMSGRINLAFASVNTSIVLASTTGKGSKQAILYVSMDNGNSWKRLQFESPINQLFGGQGWYNNFITPHPYETYSFYIGGVNINKLSIRNFETGQAILSPISDAYSEFDGPNQFLQWSGMSNIKGLHPDHHQLLILNNKKDSSFQLLTATDGGVYMSKRDHQPGEKDNSWNFASYGLHSTHFFDIDKHPYKDQFFCGTQENGSWVSPTNPSISSKYRRGLPGDGFDVIWHQSNPDILIGSIYNNHFFRSLDGGFSFKKVGNDLLDIDEAAPFFSKIVDAPNQPNLLYTIGESGVWFSENFGDSWMLSPINKLWKRTDYMDINVSTVNPKIIWAGSEITEDNRIHVSKDGGLTFTATSDFKYNGKSLGQISKIVSDPILPNVAYITFAFNDSPKIIKTDDYGKTWKDISGYANTSRHPLPNVQVYDLFVFPYNNQILWAGTEIGLFQTLDGGKSWHRLKSNFPATSVFNIHYRDNSIFIGSQGKGIWSLHLDVSLQPKILSSYYDKQKELIVEMENVSQYDSLQFYNKGQLIDSGKIEITGNYVKFKTEDVLSDLSVIGYKNSLPYTSRSSNNSPFEFGNSVSHFHFDHKSDSVENKLTGNLFNQFSAPGFSYSLHTEHPYKVNETKYSYLKSPIVLDRYTSTLYYKDIALIDTNDHVSIQASKDLVHWKNISGNYNASFNTDWTFTINKKDPMGSQNLEVPHSINLLEHFSPQDTVYFRFELSSTKSKNNWGWAISYIDIQGKHDTEYNNVVFNNLIPIQASVSPSIVSDQKINVEILSNDKKLLDIKIMNLIGNNVLERKYIKLNKGWNKYPLTLPYLTDGMYIINLEYDDKVTSLKFMVSKKKDKHIII